MTKWLELKYCADTKYNRTGVILYCGNLSYYFQNTYTDPILDIVLRCKTIISCKRGRCNQKHSFLKNYLLDVRHVYFIDDLYQ